MMVTRIIVVLWMLLAIYYDYVEETANVITCMLWAILFVLMGILEKLEEK